MLDFGRTPQWNCPIPESDAALAASTHEQPEDVHGASSTAHGQDNTHGQVTGAWALTGQYLLLFWSETILLNSSYPPQIVTTEIKKCDWSHIEDSKDYL